MPMPRHAELQRRDSRLRKHALHRRMRSRLRFSLLPLATLPTCLLCHLLFPLPALSEEETDCLLPNSPVFTGEDSLKLTDWLADAQLISFLVGVPEHQACVWAVTHTIGQAKQVWSNAHLDVNTTVLTCASLTDVFRAGLGIHNDE